MEKIAELLVNWEGGENSDQADVRAQIRAIACVAAALERIADALEAQREDDTNPHILHGEELARAIQEHNT